MQWTRKAFDIVEVTCCLRHTRSLESAQRAGWRGLQPELQNRQRQRQSRYRLATRRICGIWLQAQLASSAGTLTSKPGVQHNTLVITREQLQEIRALRERAEAQECAEKK